MHRSSTSCHSSRSRFASIASPHNRLRFDRPKLSHPLPSTCASSSSNGRGRGPEELNDPAQIGASGVGREAVKDFGGEVSLNKYMMLPLEQYFVLDPQQIRFIEANRFLLTVPRQTFFSLWLEPEVEVSVQNLGQRIILQAERCRIKGSDHVENMKLDSRFALRFVTELTWQSDGAVGWIDAKLESKVWCEVIPPFNIMPREVLVSSCNAVMRALVGSLLPMFCSRLAKDYEKWATNDVYRNTRAQRSIPLPVVL